jgi:hypothetical protein
MPELDCTSLWPVMSDQEQDTDKQGPSGELASVIAMPEPPAMPVIDWAEVAPPMPEVPVIEDKKTD